MVRLELVLLFAGIAELVQSSLIDNIFRGPLTFLDPISPAGSNPSANSSSAVGIIFIQGGSIPVKSYAPLISLVQNTSAFPVCK
jgi:hypothetical protein